MREILKKVEQSELRVKQTREETEIKLYYFVGVVKDMMEKTHKAWLFKYIRVFSDYCASQIKVIVWILSYWMLNMFMIFRVVCRFTKKPSLHRIKKEMTFWLLIKTIITMNLLAPTLWYIYRYYIQVGGYSKVMSKEKIRDFITGETGLKSIVFKVKDEMRTWNKVDLKTFVDHSVEDD